LGIPDSISKRRQNSFLYFIWNSRFLVSLKSRYFPSEPAESFIYLLKPRYFLLNFLIYLRTRISFSFISEPRYLLLKNPDNQIAFLVSLKFRYFTIRDRFSFYSLGAQIFTPKPRYLVALETRFLLFENPDRFSRFSWNPNIYYWRTQISFLISETNISTSFYTDISISSVGSPGTKTSLVGFPRTKISYTCSHGTQISSVG